MPFDDSGFRHFEDAGDLIERAAALIESEHAWCQGTLRDHEGRHCALGALIAVAFGDADGGQMAMNLAITRESLDNTPMHLIPTVEIFQQAVHYLDAAALRRRYSTMMILNDWKRRFRRSYQHRLVLKVMHEAALYAKA